MTVQTAQFTTALSRDGDFRAVLDNSTYQALPADWLIAVTDVVGSRDAIAAGRYKPVNMAGVAMISALMNALECQDLPFVFSGDGAAIVCAPFDRAVVTETLAKTVTWVKEELQLSLRAALVPVAVVRREGFDVLVRTIQISEAVNNYAFRGGGMSRAEDLMKSGQYAIAPAPAGQKPDLAGLSCRWMPVKPRQASIVSIIVEATDNAAKEFPLLGNRVLQLAGMDLKLSGSPMPEAGPIAAWPADGLDLEARAARTTMPLAAYKARLYVTTLIGWILFKTGATIAGFNPRRYRRYTSLNTDFRKFHDGLRMTVSLGKAELRTLNDFLETEKRANRIRYGLCIQDSAVLTCYVPSVTSDAHFHFLDGAGGGYAQAATNMKT